MTVLTALWFGPQGYTTGDYAAIQKSAEIGRVVREGDVSNLWFHLIQQAGLNLFGEVGARLVTLLFAAATVGLLVSVIYMLVHRHASMLAGLLMVGSLPFVSMATSLQPVIMLAFWPLALMAIALNLLRRQRKGARIFWWLTFIIAATLAMFTPLMWLVLGLMMVASFFHPHARHSIRVLGWWRVFGIIPLATIVCLVGFTWWRDGSVAQLVGVSRSFSLDVLMVNARLAVDAVIGRGITMAGGVMYPLMSFGVGALALLGLIKMVSHKHALRSYFLGLGVLLGGLMSIVAPSFLIIEFVFLMLAAGVGLQALIDEWYGFFPFNPYARIFGLIPLALFVGVVVATDVMHIFQVNQYSASAVRQRDEGIVAARSLVTTPSTGAVTIVVPQQKFHLYRFAFDQTVRVTTSFSPDPTRTILVDPEVGDYGVPKKMLTNDNAQDGLEFRVY